MSEPAPIYHIPHARSNGRLRKRLEATYRSQLSAVIETERLMVEMGYLQPEQRRILSREERRNIDNEKSLVVE